MLAGQARQIRYRSISALLPTLKCRRYLIPLARFYMDLSDCSTAYIRHYGLRPSSVGLTAGLNGSYHRTLPAPGNGAGAHAAGLWLRGAETGTRTIAPASCCLPHRWTRSALPRGDFGDQYPALAGLTLRHSIAGRRRIA